MVKRLIACLLCIALLITAAPAAQAARGENSITLTPYAGLITDNVFQYYSEFTNYNATSIVMSPGERITTPAFHAALSDHLSFVNMHVSSSNPDVATARFCSVGRSPVGGIANTFKGLEIVAHGVGTATITADFDTVVQGGLQDKRATTHQTKTFTIQVADGSLTVDLAFSANEALVDWTQEYKDRVRNEGSWLQMQEVLKQKHGQAYALKGTETMFMIGTGMAVNGTVQVLLMAAGVSASTGVGVGFAAGLLVTAIGMAALTNFSGDFKKTDVTDEIRGVGVDVMQGTVDAVEMKTALGKNLQSGLSNGISIATSALDIELTEAQRRKAADLAFGPNARIVPPAVDLSIRVTNTGTETISGATLYLSSHSLSLTGTFGPQQENRVISLPDIAPGATHLDSLTVYPTIAYRQTPSNGEKEQVYEGSMSGKCVYFDPVLEQELTVDAAASLPVYSRLDMNDKAECDKNAEEAARFKRIIGVDCPVSVTIQDAAGKELAVLAEDGDIYQDENLMAYVSGEHKLLSFHQDAVKDYRFILTATDNGTMNVLGMDSDGLLNVSGYEEVPLSKGDTFTMELSGQVPVRISGGSGKLPELQVLNEDSLVKALEKTDISKGYVPMAARALASGWVSDHIVSDSYQKEMTLAQLSVLLIHLYELRCSLITGDLTASYLEATDDTEDNDLPIRVARWAELLPESLSDSQGSRIVDRTLFNETVMDTLNRTGAAVHTADGLIPGEAVTLGAAYAALGRLYTCTNSDESHISAQIPELQAKTVESLTSHEMANGFTIRYRQNDPAKSMLRTFSVLGHENWNAFTDVNVFDLIYGRVEGVRQLTEDYLPNQDSSAAPVDIRNMNGQGKQAQLTFYSLESAANFSENGREFVCVPFYYLSAGKLYQDQIYLAVISYWTDEDGGKNNELTVLADQDQIRAFLKQAIQSRRDHENVQEYIRLENGMEGEAVLRLQKALAEEGFLTAEPSGIYDADTGKAVRGFKKDKGLQQDNIADELMQRLLYHSITADAVLMENWLNASP